MQELQLAVNLIGWRLFTRRKEDKAFLPVKKKVMERDEYTCVYCGFQAKEFQEVINLDGNYGNNALNNMATACCFCVQCLFLQAVGLDEMSGGQLIYLPEMSQADLNSFCHVLFCAMGNNTGYQDGAQAIYRSFRFRAQPVETKFGSGTSNPSAFGQMMIEYMSRNKVKQSDVMKDLRLLPSNTKFRIQLDAWAASALQELEAESAAEAGA
ncbi:MAG TPA: type IVB secretion system protein IcmJDotN [Gammaproteobacteria bacterium]|jgi:intracellular multiplication protein IcmJ|nr:type IVB secretion system protein IcmJDotN [Gammaproteobacteria bacterium]